MSSSFLQETVKRPFKVTDRLRQIRKGIVAKSLKDLTKKAMDKLGYDDRQEVYLVLEEDGTEVDDEEYFQSLPDNTRLMLLHHQDIWSPVGPPYMYVQNISFQNPLIIERRSLLYQFI